MPELPEVETIRRDLESNILNIKIINVSIRKNKIVRGCNRRFKANLLNSNFVKVDRIGKLLMFQISKSDNWMLVHLKMTGQLIFKDKQNVLAGGHSFSKNDFALPHKHTHVIFTFKNGAKLFFNDLRQFGYLQIIDSKSREEIMQKNYGIEPLTSSFKLEDFKNIFKNRTTSLKAILLNQKLIAGLGNIYVDEACFMSGVRPDRIAKSLSQKELEKLFTAINKIITKAIKYRGTTFNNYVDTSGQIGNFVKHLQVYGRGGESCKVCGTKIEKIKLAGRGTHFCLKCQK